MKILILNIRGCTDFLWRRGVQLLFRFNRPLRRPRRPSEKFYIYILVDWVPFIMPLSLIQSKNSSSALSFIPHIYNPIMHSQSIPVDVSWIETMGAYNATHIPLPYLAAMLLAVLVLSTYRHSQKNDIILNPKLPWELTSRRTKKEFISRAQQMIEGWFKKNPHKSVHVMADVGEMKVLPPHVTDEIRNDDRLSFGRWIFVVGLLIYLYLD